MFSVSQSIITRSLVNSCTSWLMISGSACPKYEFFYSASPSIPKKLMSPILGF
uniref:Uncharacterized protein n=1 Tax=Rhizophora mucronata TaxID=61149 RepID=A0A2P2NT19_RHIMU